MPGSGTRSSPRARQCPKPIASFAWPIDNRPNGPQKPGVRSEELVGTAPGTHWLVKLAERLRCDQCAAPRDQGLFIERSRQPAAEQYPEYDQIARYLKRKVNNRMQIGEHHNSSHG